LFKASFTAIYNALSGRLKVIRILVDADLILEALMNRNTVTDVRDLLDKVNPWIQMYITDVGWEKIYTYLNHLQNTKIAEMVINWLQQKIQICSVNQNILQQARSSPIKDFESAVEVICASYQKLDAIVTHKRDNFAEAADIFWVWSIAELWIRANLESQLETEQLQKVCCSLLSEELDDFCKHSKRIE
jgi:hypothetical protein